MGLQEARQGDKGSRAVERLEQKWPQKEECMERDTLQSSPEDGTGTEHPAIRRVQTLDLGSSHGGAGEEGNPGGE